MWQLKEALVSATVGAWTVVASANRSVAGTYDTWTSWSDVDWRDSLSVSANPGSWMLLKSPTGTRGPFWLLFEISSTSVSVGTHTRFWILTEEPDLSNLVAWRLPPISEIPRAYASCTMAVTTSGGVSGSNFVDIIVADDGSFCMTNRVCPSDSGGISYPVLYLFFNILDDVPPQDPYGFVLLAKGAMASNETQQSAEWEQGIGLDPDGVSSTRSMVRTYPINTGGTLAFQATPANNFAEDPSRGRYYSEKIPIFCTTEGRRGIRGTLSDIWWAPYNVTTGVCGFIDTSTKVCCMQCFWLPCPGDPWIL